MKLQLGKHLKRKLEFQRISRLCLEKLDRRLGKGLEPVFRYRLVPGTANQILRGIAAEFFCESLLDDTQGYFARAKSRDLYSPGILFCKPLDFLIDLVLRDFDQKILLAAADIHNFNSQFRL